MSSPFKLHTLEELSNPHIPLIIPGPAMPPEKEASSHPHVAEVSKPTTTQSARLPDLNPITIPKINKLEKGADFSKWADQVHKTLKTSCLDDLISKLPRPDNKDPSYATWRPWSLTVRSWLFTQMTNDMLDYVLVFFRRNGEKGPLPRYADEMFQLIKLASNTSAGTQQRAVSYFWNMRRADYPSSQKYVKAWQDIIGRLRSMDHEVAPYIAIEIMLSELEKEMPSTVAKTRTRIQGTESTLGRSTFTDLCQQLMRDASSDENNEPARGN